MIYSIIYIRGDYMLKICENCGIEFTPNNGKQVCCSKRCNTEKWRKLNPEKFQESQRKNEEKRKGINRYNSEVRKEWYKNKASDSEWRENINKKEVLNLAKEKYGDLAGLAQQYLFYWKREA